MSGPAPPLRAVSNGVSRSIRARARTVPGSALGLLVSLAAAACASMSFSDRTGCLLSVDWFATNAPVRVSNCLESGAPVHVRDSSGMTPLHWAVTSLPRHQDPEVTGRLAHLLVSSLLGAGADVNARDRFYRTPLHMAALMHSKSPFGNPAVVFAILDAGADVNVRDHEGTTPLHLAVWGDLSGVVSELLFAGSYVNAQDASGRTPLHYAAEHSESGDVVKALLEAGAKTTIPDGRGDTARDLAQTRGRRYPEFKASAVFRLLVSRPSAGSP